MARKAKTPTTYVEYSSNNSGGHWWLTDENWAALEKAGWKVVWVKLEHAFSDAGDYVREPDGTPRLVPAGEGNSKYARLGKLGKDGRWLGALAKKAYRTGVSNLREAVDEWERVTGQSALDAGCPCCGQPHNFTFYRDGDWVESGPETSYSASWS